MSMRYCQTAIVGCHVYTLLVRIHVLLLMGTSSLTLAFDNAQQFPLSTRQALVDRSKRINPPPTTTTTTSTGQYGPAGWSNRAATVLTPVSLDGIYTADRPFYWNNIDVGCRATIVELPSTLTTNNNNKKSDLWVHSPVNLDGPMIQSLDRIGTVRCVVTPNYEHTKFAAAWYQNYNNNQQQKTMQQPIIMIGCPGLAERMPDIPWQGEIPVAYRPPGWRGSTSSTQKKQNEEFDRAGYWDTSVLQCLHVNVEKNPFTGRPFFNEVVFFHEPSKTLITTDFFWNYPASGVPNAEFGRDDAWELAPTLDVGVPIGSRAWKFGMDKVYAPFYNNLMVTDRAEYHAIADHIIDVWRPEIVVPAHGDILRGRDVIRPILQQFFGRPRRG
jgi:hypothetical protein